MSERLQQLIADWRARSQPQLEGYLSPISRCCAEEIISCAEELAEEVSIEAQAATILSDAIHELARSLRFACHDYRDARDEETAARFDRFADEALDLARLAIAPMVTHWQLIDTAPKDRDIVLAAQPTPAITRWLIDVGRHETTGGVGEPLKHSWGWRWSLVTPTHWMPLPPAPSVEPPASTNAVDPSAQPQER